MSGGLSLHRLGHSLDKLGVLRRSTAIKAGAKYSDNLKEVFREVLLKRGIFAAIEDNPTLRASQIALQPQTGAGDPCA